jgi:hypothetical protein
MIFGLIKSKHLKITVLNFIVFMEKSMKKINIRGKIKKDGKTLRIKKTIPI